MHADRETKTVGGRVNGGGRLACIEKKGGGRLPGTWALTLTRPKTGGWALTREWALTRDTTVCPFEVPSFHIDPVSVHIMKG